MITILPTKTPVELKLEAIDSHLKLVENYIKGAAHALNSTMDEFWNCPDELLLDILNSKGPVEMENIFTSHANNATNINNSLAERGIGPIALIGLRKPIKVNDQGLFEMDWPVIDEPILEL